MIMSLEVELTWMWNLENPVKSKIFYKNGTYMPYAKYPVN